VPHCAENGTKFNSGPEAKFNGLIGLLNYAIFTYIFVLSKEKFLF
jgi:hypothetical protein